MPASPQQRTETPDIQRTRGRRRVKPCQESFCCKGQYGIGSGMETLANMLRPYGTVSVHQWYDRDVIVGQARAFQTGGKDRVVVIIGYSLGGNQAPDYGDDLPTCDVTVIIRSEHLQRRSR